MLNTAYAEQLEKHGFVAVDHQKPHVFPVKVRPVQVIAEDGTPVEIENHRAIFREDTRKVLSVMTDRYELVPNEIVFEAIEQAIGQSGLDITDMRIGTDMAMNGARTFRQYLFPGHMKRIGSADIALRIIAFNSYDGSSGIKLRGGFYNFVCANTAVIGEDLASISYRHTEGFKIDEMAQSVVAACDGYNRGIEGMQNWPKIRVSDMQAAKVFKALPSASRQLVDHLVHRFVEVKHETKHPNGGANVWAVYNVLSNWSTHGETKGENGAATRATRELQVLKVTQTPAWKELLAA